LARASSSSTDLSGDHHRAGRVERPSLGARLLFQLPGVRRVRAQIEPYAAHWRAANEVALGRSGPLWLVLGDSTAQGIGASAYDRGWVGQLRELITTEEEPWRVVNLSLSGGQVRHVLEHQLPAAGELGVEPDLVTVAVGANDIRPRRRAALAPALELLLASLPERAVVGTIPGRPSTVEPFNELIRERSRRHGLRVAETATAIMPPWRGKLAADYFHPNDVGYAAWARAFAAALKG
jgi:lysophospholipase L1-like esterase